MALHGVPYVAQTDSKLVRVLGDASKPVTFFAPTDEVSLHDYNTASSSPRLAQFLIMQRSAGHSTQIPRVVRACYCDDHAMLLQAWMKLAETTNCSIDGLLSRTTEMAEMANYFIANSGYTYSELEAGVTLTTLYSTRCASSGFW